MKAKVTCKLYGSLHACPPSPRCAVQHVTRSVRIRARLRSLGLRPVQIWGCRTRARPPSWPRHIGKVAAMIAASSEQAAEGSGLSWTPSRRPRGRRRSPRRDLDRVRRRPRGRATRGGDRAGRRFDATASITICPLHDRSHRRTAFRPLVEPGAATASTPRSRLMADKITTVSKARFGQRLRRAQRRGRPAGWIGRCWCFRGWRGSTRASSKMVR